MPGAILKLLLSVPVAHAGDEEQELVPDSDLSETTEAPAGEEAALVGFTAPAAKPTAKIDSSTALVQSDYAPLADMGGDFRAVWVYAPTSATSDLLVYMHGNNAYVTVSPSKPTGDFPSWRPATVEGDDLREWATWKEHDLKTTTRSGGSGPVVLAPEVGIPNPATPKVKPCKATSKAPCLDGPWALTASGKIGTSLEGMMHDALAKAGGEGLEHPLAAQKPDVQHVILVGHSGGGLPLQAAIDSPRVRTQPSDVWLLDCTYSWTNPQKWLQLVNEWKAHNWLGGSPSPSRLVVVYIEGTGTATYARTDKNSIWNALASYGSQRTEVTWGTPGVAAALKSPIVFIKVPAGMPGVDHGHIPDVLMPELIATACSGACQPQTNTPAPSSELEQQEPAPEE